MAKQVTTLQYDPLHPLARGITLLEASAGTGKTYSIADLVVRLVAEEGLSISEILVVSFTRAVTSELRERVRRRLREADAAARRARDEGVFPDPAAEPVLFRLTDPSQASPEQLQTRSDALESAYQSFDESSIHTIHGFCQQTLRDSAFESDLDFERELLENVGPLLEDLVDDFIANNFRRAPRDWYLYLTDFAKIDRKDLLQLARVVEAEPDARVIWTDGKDQRTGREEAEQVWRRAWAAFCDSWQGQAGKLAVERILTALKAGAFADTKAYSPRRPKMRAKKFDEWLEGEPQVKGTLHEGIDLAEYFSAGTLVKHSVGGRSPDLGAEVNELFRLGQRVVVGGADLFRSRFIEYVREELPRRKRDRNILSYNDLLRALAQGLARPEIRQRLRQSVQERFGAALVDEFQDTDPIQWDIFRKVFDKGAFLYLIGDPKQAIYAFRGADVHTYVGARSEAKAGAFTMKTNWRSDRRYVQALNRLLSQEGVFAQSGIEYVEVDAAPKHRADRLVFPEGERAPLQLRFFPRTLRGGGELTKGWLEEQFPVQVAADVVKMLGSGATLSADEDDRPPRPVEPGDMAVLVRKHKEARAVQQALRRANVPSVISGAGRIFGAPEAVTLQRLADALLRPSSESEAKALWSGPLFGVGARELVDTDSAAWSVWLERLGDWSLLWREKGFMAMLRRIFDEGDVPARLLARRDGQRVMTNVLHLAELLHAAEVREHMAPTILAAWLQTKRAASDLGDAEEELRLETDADAVQIVTIHRCKGLEYPIVWCPYLWDGELLKPYFGEIRNLSFHPDGKKLERALDVRIDDKCPTKSLHVQKAARERQAENLRLLYVAMTRAKHRCVVYWAAAPRAETSPLASVLHSGFPPQRATNDAGEDRVDATARRFPGLSDEQILADLRKLETSSDSLIEVVSAELPVPRRHEASHPVAAQPRTRPFERERLDRWWRRSSFSALTRGAEHGAVAEGSPEADGVDHDPAGEPAQPGKVGAEIPDGAPNVPLWDFPRGTQPGTFLHEVLEVFDFSELGKAGALSRVLETRMPHHRIADRYRDVLVEGLSAALRTPLGPSAGGGRLVDIPRADRLDEMSFDLPLSGGLERIGSGVTVRRIADAFGRHVDATRAYDGGYVDRLATLSGQPPVRGFLTGSIDLVFRRVIAGRPRFFLVDYKSNWIGDREPPRSTVHHYTPAAMRRVMSEHHYYLQYHLYAVALHRYLRSRLGAGYDYARDFGGVRYLFLRGMIGADGPAHDGVPFGVFTDRPSRALIDDLDEVLRNPGGGT